MIKKTFWLLGLIWLSAGSLHAQETVPGLSLTQLLDSAVQGNYLLQSNEKQTAIKLAEIEILKTNYQPHIAASANLSYWKWLMPNKAKLLGNTLTDVYTDISEFSDRHFTMEIVMDMFADKFAGMLNVDLREEGLTDYERREAEKLFYDKYSRKEWTFRREYDRTTVVSTKTSGGVLTLRCNMFDGVIRSLCITGDFLVAQSAEFERLCAALKGLNLIAAIEKIREFRQVPLYVREGLINLLAEVRENQ